MAKIDLEEKRIFIVVSGDPRQIAFFQGIISRHVSNSTVFGAKDGFEALFRMENSRPHVVISDMQLPKLSGIELATKMLANSKFSEASIILVTPLPDKEHFVDQVVTGQVQFLTEISNEPSIVSCLTRGLNRLVDEETLSYRLKFLAPNEMLFKQGDQANCVYIVRRGDLQAFKEDGAETMLLGNISTGEFVGEMAHINGEPRSASVRAVSDCELIEIPMGTLDMVLFSKPAWAKALVATLSRRLKRTNNALSDSK
jgi:CRP/FNR family transcriptional regulator, cyclic AMP receptor protein